ncbi:bifunctional peptidase and (3S)-lysyl hydroxylase Jmjd7 [Dermacentor silvarum]|uniref:bifunctional peptidase and (3S)-lysyl hydroxylase Jmjd7 n=1 Tax=Dermacentor silvarum TaxID=543639 RepID=UPI0018978110|nr:bifunctional peptidase and (3S)-lysyl hydroxylase Jmjd7 [Dermacentor silvarum]
MNGRQPVPLHDALARFNENCKDLFHSRTVAEITEVPSPLEFHRRWVSPNLPVVVRGGASHWAAVNKWTHAYLREKIGDLAVTVAVTPNGFADAVHGSVFVTPEERVMKFGEFLDILERRERSNAVFYIQKQNSNFTDEFRKLAGDVETDVCWATAAFGKTPDAVNFWMGDERAVTSMHRDHYENIYCVVSGHKDFILLPPTDLPWVPYENYKTGQFHEVANGQFDVIASGDDSSVPWISLDPENPDFDRYPHYRHASPVKCRVSAGDILYLPCLWFHHVRQSHGCVALNYWYDMEFDIKYCYYKLLEDLSLISKNC